MLRRAILICAFAAPVAAQESADVVRFNRDIRPILAEQCLLCHGPDARERKAGLRLDDPDSAFAPREGGAAIVPGDPARSLLVQRVHAEDPDERMPPPSSRKSLSPDEIELLSRWIEQGAEYERHWSFIEPRCPPVPPSDGDGWVRNEVDAFALERMRTAGLAPSPAAGRSELIRRVALDVTGLPPTPAEVDAFERDAKPGAYERMVDRYLASPHYGEHMARYWLDLARYADTSGYQYDRKREMWAWRDWVIRAYDSNMPFDQFTVEQLAGDLLPNASIDQQIATGFNRNHPITIEGGVVDEEYRVEYVMDRVKTTTATWLGLTMECARCHDHKYDPLSQREFYSLFAFFNRVPERGLNGFDPKLSVTVSAAREAAARIDEDIAAIERESLASPRELKRWETRLSKARWRTLGRAKDGRLEVAAPAGTWSAFKTAATDVRVLAQPPASQVTRGRFVRVELPGRKQYLSLAEVRVLAGGRNVAEGRPAKQSSTGFSGPPRLAVDGRTDGVHRNGSVSHTNLQDSPWWEVDLGSEMPIESVEVWNRTDCCGERLDGCRITILDGGRGVTFVHDLESRPTPSYAVSTGGARTLELVRTRDLWVLAEPFAPVPGTELSIEIEGESGRVQLSGEPALHALAAATEDVVRVLDLEPVDRTDADRALLARFYLRHDPSRADVRRRIEERRAEKQRVLAAGKTSVLVMRDAPKPRVTRLLRRGQYDQPGEIVEADVPAVLPPFGDRRRDRLGFARWLTAPDHPLTARVAVNRYWQRLFGRGLVETLEDFGSRGTPPSHPELLDWLATQFVADGWDVKAMLRRLLVSATYRQQSRVTPQMLKNDPDGAMLTRAPRLRLDAETIRDQALAVAGLLDPTRLGPSVYPYQPGGLWLEINNRPGYSRAYPEPKREGAYRRSLYTYWKRTLPPPSMQLFDAPNREACMVRRSRTSTPLQALVLLHDPQFVEAGRALAGRVLREVSGGSDRERIEHVFRLTTGRRPDVSELREIQAYLREERSRFTADSSGAERALAVGLAPMPADWNPAELAAWMSVARLLLNLDEVIHR